MDVAGGDGDGTPDADGDGDGGAGAGDDCASAGRLESAKSAISAADFIAWSIVRATGRFLAHLRTGSHEVAPH